MNKIFFLFIGLGLAQNKVSSTYDTPSSKDVTVEENTSNAINHKTSKNLKITVGFLGVSFIVLGLINYLYEYSGQIPNPDCLLNPAGLPINCCELERIQPGFCPFDYATLPLTIEGILPNQQSVTGFVLQCVAGAISILAVILSSSGDKKSIPAWVKQSLVAVADIILGILIIVGESIANESDMCGLSGNNIASILGLIIGILLVIEGSLITGIIFLNNNKFQF
jgi:hypothetical protein